MSAHAKDLAPNMGRDIADIPSIPQRLAGEDTHSDQGSYFIAIGPPFSRVLLTDILEATDVLASRCGERSEFLTRSAVRMRDKWLYLARMTTLLKVSAEAKAKAEAKADAEARAEENVGEKRVKMKERRARLNEAKEQMAEARAQLGDARAQMTEANEELEEARVQLTNVRLG